MTRDQTRDSERLEPGWTALRGGEWQRARSCFEQAVLQVPSPRAYEGLSWAAWWLDDPSVVFDARERAFLGYRDSGDAASAARMATWLAADQLDFNGALATANGWLERARRLLESTSTQGDPERGKRAFQEFAEQNDSGKQGGPSEYRYEYLLLVADKLDR